MSFNIVKTQLDKFKNIHSICKTIELITILTLQFYSSKMINGIKMIPLIFCYVKECYRLNNVLKSHLVVPFFSDKSCSGIINNNLLFFLKETFLLMRYNNVLASLAGTSKKNIFFTSISESIILNLYNLSSDTVNFYSSFLVFKEILLLNNTMFYNYKYKDTNITLYVTSKSSYLEELNKDIYYNVRDITNYYSYKKNNHRRNYSTKIRPFKYIYNKGLFLVIKETSSFLILRHLDSEWSESIKEEEDKTLIIYFNDHFKKKGSFSLSECVYFEKTHKTINNIDSIICVNDHNILSLSEKYDAGYIRIEDIIISGTNVNNFIKKDFFIDVVFLYDKVYRKDFLLFYSSYIKKIKPSFYFRALNLFENKLLAPFLILSYGIILFFTIICSFLIYYIYTDFISFDLYAFYLFTVKL